MVNINLLPWRRFEREYQNRLLKKIFISTISIALFILIIVHALISHQEKLWQANVAATNKKLSLYREINAQNTSNITAFSEVNTPKQYDKHDFAIRLFSELSKRNAGKVCFTDIERMDKTLLFSGKARSILELTEFLRGWNAAYLFNEIKINSIETQENGFVHFRFQAM